MTAPCCRSTPQQPEWRPPSPRVSLWTSSAGARGTVTHRRLAPGDNHQRLPDHQRGCDDQPWGTHTTRGAVGFRSKSARAWQVLSKQAVQTAAQLHFRGAHPLTCGGSPHQGAAPCVRESCVVRIPSETSCCTSSRMFIPRSVTSVSFTNSLTMLAMVATRPAERTSDDTSAKRTALRQNARVCRPSAGDRTRRAQQDSFQAACPAHTRRLAVCPVGGSRQRRSLTTVDSPWASTPRGCASASLAHVWCHRRR